MSKLSSDQSALICEHIFNKLRDVKLVIYETDGALELLCGESDHDGGNSYYWVCIGHVFFDDPTLRHIPAIPIGCEAERSRKGSEWLITALSPDC